MISMLVLVPATMAMAAMDHSFITKYEGTKTCLSCHEKVAKDVHASHHYQFKSKVTDLIGWEGSVAGKLGGTNDFCMTPDFNWIGQLTSVVKKETKPGGCGQCHVGLGLKPTAEATQEQLENIDCLICHAPAKEYSRTVIKDGDKFKLAPASTVDVNAVAKKVARPTNANCLACHAKSGGGPNYKRGDLEPAHATATKDLDVHMSAGVKCTDCHKTKNHKISGRGVDLRASDYPEYKVKCENCHKEKPHKNAILNTHAVNAVYCTACHIPEFAKTTATDMHRDWSQAEVSELKDLYEPKITFKKNVKPVFAWWNGKSLAHKTNDPIALNDKGVLTMFKPDGSINDKKAKIYAFKYHTAKLPYDTESKVLAPPKAGAVFQTGNVLGGIKKGFEEWLKKPYVKHDFVNTERYMGLFHEVAPKEKALSCNDCHGENGVMDFKALGYADNPWKVGGRLTVTQSPGTKTGLAVTREEFANALLEKGLPVIFTGATLDPGATITRGEAQAMIDRAYKHLEKSIPSAIRDGRLSDSLMDNELPYVQKRLN